MRILKKCLAAVLLLWSATQTVWAADVKECLVVHLSDGTNVSYVLEEKPVVTYTATTAHIESTTLTDDYNLAEVVNFTFQDITSLVENPVSDEVRITVTSEQVDIQGLPEGTAVTLADIQGRVFAAASAGFDCTVSFATGNLPAGVYVVATSAGRAFKIMRK